jgi:hypothetical protein
MGDSGGPLFEFLLFAMRVEEEAVMAEEYLEAMERAANHKQLKWFTWRAACCGLKLKSEPGGADTAQLRKEALRGPMLQPIVTVLRSSIVMHFLAVSIVSKGGNQIKLPTKINYVNSCLVSM